MSDVETNLGKIVLGLAKHVTYVQFRRSESIMSNSMFVIKAYIVKNGATTSHEELINEPVLAQIEDPDVIVDAFLARLKSVPVKR